MDLFRKMTSLGFLILSIVVKTCMLSPEGPHVYKIETRSLRKDWELIPINYEKHSKVSNNCMNLAGFPDKSAF